MSWTDERVEQLKKLWSDGFSASQIAAELGGVTRNAVIGKVHRLGLSGRAKTPVAQPARAKKAPARQPGNPHIRPHGGLDSVGNTALKIDFVPQSKPQIVVQPKIFTLSDAPLVENAGILELTEATCKWPVGDPGDQSFHFCARRSESGIPYCGYHARVAYQPVSDRRRDKRVAIG
ncbi:MAG: GcrA family cell cycle regulator [Ancalomicrobiaceae bacterium]|nr:GcrA family cell cycle regulator [Ancalomicrobiaceae bacterium]